MLALLDNNVPRSVGLLLGDRGWDIVEVRAVLAHDAPDVDVLAYARATVRVLLTHDRGLARRARAAGHPSVWLRTPETQDRDRLESCLAEVEAALAGGYPQVEVTKAGARVLAR